MSFSMGGYIVIFCVVGSLAKDAKRLINENNRENEEIPVIKLKINFLELRK